MHAFWAKFALFVRDLQNQLTKSGAIRVKIRTTNIIERSFREVRRRTRPIGCFENDSSVNRIIFGVISGLNKNWESKPLKESTQLT